MYEVLVYFYENYRDSADCADRHQLGRRLGTLGFEREAIQQALCWLDGLDCVASDLPPRIGAAAGGSQSLRVYGAQEVAHLGHAGIGCLRFLEDAGALSAELRELVIDRALAASESPLDLDDLKIIVMMVYWRAGVCPGALVLDELTDDPRHRLAH